MVSALLVYMLDCPSGEREFLVQHPCDDLSSIILYTPFLHSFARGFCNVPMGIGSLMFPRVGRCLFKFYYQTILIFLVDVSCPDVSNMFA